MAASLRYDVLVSGLLPAHDELLPTGDRPHWSPLSHTLIHGRTEAAVVDPPITVAQATALADWIAQFGTRLSFIYITHWHADHWLGTGVLLNRFPGATVYASAATIGRMTEGTPAGVLAALWTSHVHQYLAEIGDGGFAAWRHGLDVVESLHPAHVVAGHKDATRADDPATIAETRRYLEDSERLLAAGPGRREFFDQMMARYPGRINPYTLWLSARRLLKDG